ncbi:hypothetical protein [uncultured Streptomyces sp.]|uniref:hypothetical protein n=1 Tax=uncultured Streptomyces sp. TaxID=174707 RepID=UPI002618C311|nr:hypothetical protein [uncultured Streptomyces sp.]
MLTPPAYDSMYDVLSVQVSSLDGNLNVPITLTPDQIADWTDAELLAKVAALKGAVRSLLPVGTDLKVSIGWSGNGQQTVLRESEIVHAD